MGSKITILILAATTYFSFTQGAFAQQQSSSDYSWSAERRYSPGGLYVEPILSAIREDSAIKTSQLSGIFGDTSGNANGYGLGLKLGAHISEIILLGVDARYSRVEMKDSFYEKAQANVYNLAPMIGVQTPFWGVRLMGSYITNGEFNPDAGVQGLNLKFKDPYGWRLGAGVHVAAVSVNLEYQDLTYNTTEIESVGSLAVGSNTKVDANTRGYALTVSFPVEL